MHVETCERRVGEIFEAYKIFVENGVGFFFSFIKSFHDIWCDDMPLKSFFPQFNFHCGE